MKWLDVCGAPGSGKSTLCDPIFGPHEIPIENRRPPAKWHDFLNEVTRLLYLVQPHHTFEAAIRMNNRSIRKIATVARREDERVYVQTALAQRGLGFGWRIQDLGGPAEEMTHYFRLMPVSVGVVFTEVDPEIVKQRNHARKDVPETAHEDRAHMVELMNPSIEVAKKVLHDRNVPVHLVSTEQPVEDARKQIAVCADMAPFDAEADGRSCEVEVLSPPAWWV